MSLSTPDSVRKLQRALYAKAKGTPDFRFYTLYDKVYRADVLLFAYRSCRSKGGASGVDGQTFEANASSPTFNTPARAPNRSTQLENSDQSRVSRATTRRSIRRVGISRF